MSFSKKTLEYLTDLSKLIIENKGKRTSLKTPTGFKSGSIPDDIIDGYSIAEIEYNDKKIPFIIRRPIPNGSSEYWRFSDLEQIDF